MSSKTENLELFKYDPVADKDQTFNIELALNQNWDKVDKEIAQREGLLRSSAVKEGVSDTDAIAIVDDADSSKTKRVLWSTIKSALSKIYVPLTRKINSKSLSSDVTLTGADIQVSGTDNTKIDAALSNKAESTLGQVPEIDLLAWADKQTISGAFGTNPTTTTEGVPAVTWYHGFLEVKTSGRRITLTESTGQYRTWTNCTSAGKWTKWVLLATATPPKEYEMPLRSGWTPASKSKYSKTQEGVCIVNCSAYGAGTAAENFIATLPAGFRPSERVCVSAHAYNGNAREIAEAQIAVNGDVVVYSSIEFTYISFSVAFIASD